MWQDISAMNIGDTFTMSGMYKKRTFIQWLKREQRVLQNYVIKAKTQALTEYEPEKKD